MSDAFTRWQPAALVVGVVTGGALAASGVVTSRAPAPRLDPGVVAVVGDRPIARAEFERAVASLDGLGTEADAARLRAAALERLVDEELLIAYGEELGLPHTDPRLRTELAQTVITLSNARTEERLDVDDEALRAFFDRNRSLFDATPALRVTRVFVADGSGGDARSRANSLRASWVATPDVVPPGDTPVVPLPDGPLTERDLTAALGPTATRVAMTSPTGSVSEPVRTSGGYELLRVDAREARSAPFEQVRDSVRAEYVRRENERALRRLLDERRATTPISRASAP